MTDNDTPWEPPLAGAEPAQLLGALERLRTTFRWKADDLDLAGLQATVGASTLTIGGLLKHLAINEGHANDSERPSPARALISRFTSPPRTERMPTCAGWSVT